MISITKKQNFFCCRPEDLLSLEGLNSSLAQSTGKLWCKIRAQCMIWKYDTVVPWNQIY